LILFLANFGIIFVLRYQSFSEESFLLTMFVEMPYLQIRRHLVKHILRNVEPTVEGEKEVPLLNRFD
jgi:hypothetical protein